jgi:starch synthase
VLLCAGAPDTPEIAAEMRAKVESARAKAGNGPNAAKIVWIENMVTKQEAIQLYSHCEVFCCPSVYEPFGIINLEAMACRAPVVASAVGGILEVVVDGQTGYLVPFAADPVTSFPTEPEQFSRDLATRITELLDDPKKAKAMGEAGRKRAVEQFSWTAIAAQTVELYRRLVSARR